MPAPHRRNRGASLAQHVGASTSARALDDRDNLIAARQRRDARWEAAAEALDQAAREAAESGQAIKGSDLAARADAVRAEHERARRLACHARDVSEGRAKPPVREKRPVVVLPAASSSDVPAGQETEGEDPARPRYWLGFCTDCGFEMWVHSAQPRVPLCGRCKRKRSRRKVAARQARALARKEGGRRDATVV